MTMAKRNESLPRPVEDLEALAAHYDTHDTSAEMEHGEWVDPRPMQTTSLRLPGDVVDALKALAQTRGMRYTALVREIIEHAVNGVRLAESEEFARINERLTRIEAAVVAQSEESPRKRSARKNPTSGSKTKVSAAHGRTSRVAAAPASTAKASVGARRRVAGKG
jgi:predicted DNA-binding protein